MSDDIEIMRAVYAESYGTPENLIVGDFPKFVAGPGEILINTKAAGVAFHDGLQLSGKHQIKHQMPYVPGMEIAGTIAELGDGVDGPAIGTPVMALSKGNAWAEFAKVDASQVWLMPDGVGYPEAAAISMAFSTAHCGLKWEADVQPGEVVLVTGASGSVGQAAVEIAKIMGARVIAVASTEKRLSMAKDYGADDGINYTDVSVKETVMELTGGKGVDVAFDPVMGSLFPDVLSSLAWGGRHVIIGFAGGEIPQIPSNRLLIKNRRALGMVMTYYRYDKADKMLETATTLLGWCAEGNIHPPITKTGPWAKAPEFLSEIMERKLIGRAILVA